MFAVPKGGKREGSGRKPVPGGRAVVLSCRIRPDLHAAVMAEAARLDVGLAVIVTDALRAYLAASEQP